MTLDYAEATSDAQRAATSLLDRIANRLGNYARSDAVFGDPVTQDGITVIPVARVRWGFGGGAGAGGDDGKDGEDYGEGVAAVVAFRPPPWATSRSATGRPSSAPSRTSSACGRFSSRAASPFG
jgi:hypothetical protein